MVKTLRTNHQIEHAVKRSDVVHALIFPKCCYVHIKCNYIWNPFAELPNNVREVVEVEPVLIVLGETT